MQTPDPYCTIQRHPLPQSAWDNLNVHRLLRHTEVRASQAHRGSEKHALRFMTLHGGVTQADDAESHTHSGPFKAHTDVL